MSIYLPSFYKPSQADYISKRREISAVTNAEQAQVTTTEDHGYTVGQLVRLHVPKDYGMEIDGVIGTVLTVPATTDFTIDVDTSVLPTYVTPTYPPGYTQSHVVPITGVENNVAT